MNNYLWFSYYIRYIAFNLADINSVGKWVCYNIFIPLSYKFKSIGRKKFLEFDENSGEEYRNIRNLLFLRFRFYVEDYLANIAYRKTDAPNPMVPDLEERQKWGLKMLEEMAENQKRPEVDFDYFHFKKSIHFNELARIYRWIINDWENWSNPYWKKAPYPAFDENPSRFSSLKFENKEQRKEFDRITDKAEKLDYIIEERIRGRVQRLFDNRHLLIYD